MIDLTDRPFVLSLIAGLVIILVGLACASLGVTAIINSASAINAWIVVFALLSLNASIACISGGIGHILLRHWATRVAFYGAIGIIAVNVAGILHIGGFSIKTLYAVLVMISAMWVLWYMSKRELGAFFLVSIAEHVIIILIIIMLIYSGPIDIINAESGISVTLEELKPEEKDPPMIPKPKPKPKQENKVTIPTKREEASKPVEPPKLQVKTITNVDQGSNTMASLPKLPKTFANTLDRSPRKDSILRAPGPEDGIQKSTETLMIPDKSVSSTFKGTRLTEPSAIVPAFESGKGKGGTANSRDSVYTPGTRSFTTDTQGTTTGAARPGFIGDIKGEVAGRKVVWWPRLPDEMKGTEGGSATLEIVVDPAGNVTKVNIVKKSGSPKLDRVAENYVKQIRFEKLPENIQQITQRGEIVINFELAR
jgi:TonB family protein